MLEFGIRLVRSKNFFCKSNFYKGINRVYEYKGYKFELQFHSKESIALKYKIHEFYENARKSGITSDKDRYEQEKLSEEVTNTFTVEEPICMRN